ncbi:hypothetical protein ACFL6N_05480 [Thermodesulfobacteriota bacterium]
MNVLQKTKCIILYLSAFILLSGCSLITGNAKFNLLGFLPGCKPVLFTEDKEVHLADFMKGCPTDTYLYEKYFLYTAYNLNNKKEHRIVKTDLSSKEENVYDKLEKLFPKGFRGYFRYYDDEDIYFYAWGLELPDNDQGYSYFKFDLNSSNYAGEIDLRKYNDQEFGYYKLDLTSSTITSFPIDPEFYYFSVFSDVIYYNDNSPKKNINDDTKIYTFRNGVKTYLGFMGQLPTVSPDGTKLAYFSKETTHKLMLYDIKTKTNSIITRNFIRGFHPIIRWSPDSQLVAVSTWFFTGVDINIYEVETKRLAWKAKRALSNFVFINDKMVSKLLSD